MLTITLKLGTDGLLSRNMYPQIPPKVEDTLTRPGERLVAPLMHLYEHAGNQGLSGEVQRWKGAKL